MTGVYVLGIVFLLTFYYKTKVSSFDGFKFQTGCYMEYCQVWFFNVTDTRWEVNEDVSGSTNPCSTAINVVHLFDIKSVSVGLWRISVL